MNPALFLKYSFEIHLHGDESLGKIINREERIVHREKKKSRMEP